MNSKGCAVWGVLVIATAGALPACRSDRGDDKTGGSGAAATAADGSQGSGGNAAGFESLAWRSSLDYGDEEPPWIVNDAIHGTSATDVFVVGHFGTGAGPDTCFIDRLVGDSWQTVEETDACLNSVWAASPSLVFASGYVGAGDSGIVRIDLSEGSAQNFVLEVGPTGVWGWGEEDVLAVGIGGTIVHYDGGTWAVEQSGTGADLKAVWGPDPDNVFAVGDGGTILMRAGGVWSTMDSGTSLALNDIWGSGPSDVYAVGGRDGDPGHVILHFDGIRWSLVHEGDDRVSALLGVAGRAASDICAVGAYRDADETAHALVLRFDGSAWRELPLQAEAFLWDVWPAGADAYYVVGPDDTLAIVRD